MGYVFVIGFCIQCRKLIGFNPHLVPSVVVRGNREPVCLDCVTSANQVRAANGLQLFDVRPGAYAPSDESML